MNWLLHLVGCISALGLIAAALIYPISSKAALGLLKRVAVAALSLLFLVPVVGQLLHAHPLASMLILLSVSGLAYLIRESGVAGSEQTRRLQGVERKPVLPRWEDEQ